MRSRAVGTRRIWLLVNLAVTVALVPALFITGDHSPKGPVAVSAADTLHTVPVVATAVPGMGNVVILGPTEIAALATTTTTTPPPTTAPRPVARKAVAKAPVTRARSTPTTTAAPRPRPAAKAAPTTTAPPAPDRTESGKASWYDHQAGVCAHKTLPFGTTVTVTNLANGRSTTCVVGDRGPFVEGWVIDLNPREFEQLAPRSAGVISVRLTW